MNRSEGQITQEVGGEGVGSIRRSAVLGKAALLLAFLIRVVIVPAPSFAAPPAPNWMPNFPFLAGNQVIMMWSPVPGAVKYKIYLEKTLVGESQAFQFTTAAPDQAGNFQYFVAAVDASGAEGARSQAGVVKIIKLMPPTDVTGLLSDDYKMVSLRWQRAEGAVLYNLYRSEKAGETGDLLISLQDVGHRDTTIQRGKNYFYSVKSKDISGKESAPSEPFSVNVPAVGVEVKAVAAKTMVRVAKPLFQIEGGLFGALSGPRDVALDPEQGKLFVSVFGDKAVYVFDAANGSHLQTIGGEPDSPSYLKGLHGLDIDPKRKRVYVALNGVTVFDYDGTYHPEESFPIRPEHTKEFEDPEMRRISGKPPGCTDVVFSEDYSLIYLVDNARSKVLKYDLNGKFLEELSLGPGKKSPGMFAFPTRGKVNRNAEHRGDLLVMDGFGIRVQIRDARSGQWRAFGELGESAGDFKTPFDVDVDAKNNIYTVDKDLAVVTEFDYNGKFVAVLGGENGKVHNVGSALAIAIDKKKEIVYVPDYYGGKIRAFQLVDQVIEKKK